MLSSMQQSLSDNQSSDQGIKRDRCPLPLATCLNMPISTIVICHGRPQHAYCTTPAGQEPPLPQLCMQADGVLGVLSV